MEIAISLILGGIIGALISRYFYQRSSRDLDKAYAQSKRDLEGVYERSKRDLEKANQESLRAMGGLFNQQLDGIKRLFGDRFSRMITALVVAGVIPREMEQRAQEIARGEAQQFQETASVTFGMKTSVIDNLVRRVWTDQSGGAAYGPGGPMGETKTD